MAADKKATFVSFVSDRGGVGKSTTLTQLARRLTLEGKSSLVIDMDIDSPGLSFTLPDAEAGLVDLLLEFLDTPEESTIVCAIVRRDFNLIRQQFCVEYTEAMHPIDFMPAGKIDEQYPDRVFRLNIADMYLEGIGQPLIMELKSLIKNVGLYDYIFVDSTSGLSDTAGIVTRDLADKIIYLYRINRQAAKGLELMVGAIQANCQAPILFTTIGVDKDALSDKVYNEVLGVFDRYMREGDIHTESINWEVIYEFISM